LKNFGRGLGTQDFAGAVIESPGDGVQLRLAPVGRVHAIGQVLADQAASIFIGWLLARAVRVGKVELDLHPSGQFLAPRHLKDLAVRQGFADLGRAFANLGGQLEPTPLLRSLAPRPASFGVLPVFGAGNALRNSPRGKGGRAPGRSLHG